MPEREHISSMACWCNPRILSVDAALKLKQDGTIVQADPVLHARALNVHSKDDEAVGNRREL